MKYIITLLISLFVSISVSLAQQYSWAYTAEQAPRTLPAAIKQDGSGNHYLASSTISPTDNHSQIVKRSLNQQILWQKNISGKAFINDLEINTEQHPVILGWFEESVTIGTTTLVPGQSTASGFLAEFDEEGNVLWAKKINPNGDGEFKPVDLFISPQNELYLTAEISGDHGFCSFHKANSLGEIIHSEFNDNYENRTLSHIYVDAQNRIFLSGTCGNGATFDQLTPHPTFSYQQFMVMYNAQFEAQWLQTRKYITFDHNNDMVNDGQNFYWVFNESVGNYDTVKIVKINPEGQILTTRPAPMASAFFERPNFSIDRFGNGVLVFGQYQRYFIYRYNTNLEINGYDTLYSQLGNPDGVELESYDSTFYLAAPYMSQTLAVDNFLLSNPNTGTSYPQDVFVIRWNNATQTTENQKKGQEKIRFFPNPANGQAVWLQGVYNGQQAVVFNLAGKEVMRSVLNETNPSLDISSLVNGLYTVQLKGEAGRFLHAEKLVISK